MLIVSALQSVPSGRTVRISRSAARIVPIAIVLCVALLAAAGLAPAHAGTLAGGLYHSLLIHDDGTLWAWGYNQNGELGDGATANRSTPVMVLTGVQSVAAGTNFSLALKIDGTLWTWGNNASGRLGDGTTTNRTAPVQILSGVQAVAAGDGHALAIKTDGTLWGWGRNDYGQLGDSTKVNRPAPVRLLTGVQAIGAGQDHSLAIKTDGTLWTWGRNDDGQLGDGTKVDRGAPVRVLGGVQSVSAGQFHSLALKTDGTAWAWGRSCCGQLFGGTTYDSATPVPVLGGVQAIAAGGDHSLALKTDGSLWAWGDNGFGQVGTAQNSLAPAQVLSGVRAIAGGGLHSLALKTDGTVWAWGLNESGQLGDGTTTTRAAPMVVLTGVQAAAGGAEHTLALKADGTLWSWGENYFGELGDGTVPEWIRIGVGRAEPAQILSGVRAVAAGGFFSLALKSDGTMLAWGDNFFGQLGNGTTGFGPRTPVAVASSVQAIAAGSNHSLALKADGTLWAAGGNFSGQLGDGTTTSRATQVQILSGVQAIAAGDTHSLAVKTDGTLWAWGDNSSGQLGDGTTVNRTAPVRILSGVASIAAGAAHSLAVKTDGTLWAWGANGGGQLGNGTTISQSAPVQVLIGAQIVAAGGGQSLAVKTDGTLWVWGAVAVPGAAGGAQRVPLLHPFARDIVQVAAGFRHALVVTATGRLLVWGDNAGQQLGVKHVFLSTLPVAVRDPLAAYAGADLVVEFFNPTIRNGAGTAGIGHYFITAAPAEVANIDAGGAGPGWARTGRTFRAWNDPAKAPAEAVTVCRFYARVPNSHFYTASPAECQGLKDINPTNDPGVGWSYEGTAFHSVLPQGKESPTNPLDSSCTAGYFPIYRSYNDRYSPDPARNDGNHRITPSFNDYQRSIRFLRFADEGIRFCSPAAATSSADLQATFTYPGAVTLSGAPMTAEFLFNNNGPGRGDGGGIYVSLPAEVGDWSVRCAAFNGAVCPATSDLKILREGQTVTTWPAGGTLKLTVAGTAPQVTTGGDATLNFAATVANASGSSDSTPANDTPAIAQTVVKAATACNAVPNPGSLQLGPAAQTPHVSLLAETDCAWSAQSSAPWLTVSPVSGSGDATLTLTLAANTAITQRSGSITVNGQPILVIQSGVACTFTATPDSLTFVAAGQGSVVAVASPAGCTWTAQSNDPWLAVSPASGTGPANLTITAQPNTAAGARASGITLKNLTIPVAQSGLTEVAAQPQVAGDACATLRLQREGDQINPGGVTGAQSFDVIAGGQCAWRAQSNSAWMTLTAGSGGGGNGTVRYVVEPNDGTQARSGTIAVGSKVFTVNQIGKLDTNQGGEGGGDSGGDGGSGGSSGGASG
ncbi:MAG: BACON domain-containing carbohydrate-binding protein [Betaproteobacteria bacterium]